MNQDSEMASQNVVYEVTARRWRPQEFDGVIGQEHVTTTLKNAIQSGKIAHAYLFAGPRGVGKTTTARILAKALNCVNGPTVDPCNSCSFCREIAEGRSVDVLEIDGASNNKVEQIRSHLLESVKYTPSQGKHKIYIIDEVHMLSKEAFNALLKTLEEPPAHVYFIFATTDPQKVLPTILSRCQRFDFRRISSQRIVDHLAMIAGKSGYDIERNALAIIARRAGGGMRDAESLFDQVVAFGGSSLTAQDVAEALGIVEQDVYFELIDVIRSRKTSEALLLLDTMIQQGYNLEEAAVGILEHLRNLLIVKVAPDIPELMDTAVIDLDRYRAQATSFQTEDDLLRLIQMATQMEESVRSSAMPRVQLEAGIARMTLMESSVLLSDVLSRLSELARRAESGEDASADGTASGAGPVDMAPARSHPAAVSERPAPQTPPHPPPRERPASHEEGRIQNRTEATRTLAPPRPTVVVATPDKEEVSSPQTDRVTLQAVKDQWPGMLEQIKTIRVSLGNFLKTAAIMDYQNQTVTLGFLPQFDFHKQAAEKKEHAQIIQDVFRKTFQTPVRVVCVSIATPPDEASVPVKKEPLPEVNAYTIARNDPAVKRFLDAFDGQIIGG